MDFKNNNSLGNELDDLAPPVFTSISFNDLNDFDDDDDDMPAAFATFGGDDEDIYRSAGVMTDLSSRNYFRSEPGTNLDLDDDVPDFGSRYGGMPKLEPSPYETYNPKVGPSTLDDGGLFAELPSTGSQFPPEAPGGYFDPNYHFLSRADPDILLNSVASYFDAETNVDVIVKSDKFKVKCTSYQSGRALSFNVRLYSVGTGKDQQVAVEFQRRSGCCFQFAELYRAAKEELKSSPSQRSNRDPFSNVGHMDSLLDSLEQVGLDIPFSGNGLFNKTDSYTVDTLRSLKEMLHSKSADMQLEALYSLLSMALEGEQTQDLMVRHGVIEALAEVNLGDMEEIHRCAVSVLAALSADRRNVCLSLHANGVVGRLCHLTSSGTTEMLRQTSKTMLNMSKLLGQEIVNDEFRVAVDVLTSSYDAVVQQNGAQLLDIIDAPLLSF